MHVKDEVDISEIERLAERRGGEHGHNGQEGREDRLSERKKSARARVSE